MFRGRYYRGRDGKQTEAWRLELAAHKHFGAVFESRGRGNLKLVRYFDPDEDPEGLFPRVKKQLLDAMDVWVQKGWLTRLDIEALLGRL